MGEPGDETSINYHSQGAATSNTLGMGLSPPSDVKCINDVKGIDTLDDVEKTKITVRRQRGKCYDNKLRHKRD